MAPTPDRFRAKLAAAMSDEHRGDVARRFEPGRHLDGGQHHERHGDERRHLDRRRQQPPHPVEEQHDRGAERHGAEQRGDAHAERHLALALGAVHVEPLREFRQHARMVALDLTPLVGRERQDPLAFELRQFAGEGVDLIHPPLRVEPGFPGRFLTVPSCRHVGPPATIESRPAGRRSLRRSGRASRAIPDQMRLPVVRAAIRDGF